MLDQVKCGGVGVGECCDSAEVGWFGYRLVIGRPIQPTLRVGYLQPPFSSMLSYRNWQKKLLILHTIYMYL